MKHFVRMFVAMLGVTISSAAHAQGTSSPTEIVPADQPKAADPKTTIEGWNPYLNLTATVNIVDNSSVIGQVDGTAVAIAGGIVGGGDFIRGPHVVSLSGVINEGFARTPVVPEFVKINDVAKVDGLYNYFLTKDVGLYGRLSIATSLFEGKDIRGTPTTWIDVSGATPVMLATNALEQHLTDAFKPLTITESFGAFADPIRKPEFGLSFRLGIGGRTTIANGSFALHDDPTTPTIEVIELSNVNQLGVEGFAGVQGKLVEKGPLTYKAGVAVLLPFVNDDSAHRSVTELTRVAVAANATYQLTKLLSAVYTLSVIRDPQLFPAGKDEIQVQNTFLLTFTLGIVKKKEAPKPKTKEQLELEAAKSDAAKSAAQVLDLQRQLRDAENKPPCPPAPPPPAPTDTQP